MISEERGTREDEEESQKLREIIRPHFDTEKDIEKKEQQIAILREIVRQWSIEVARKKKIAKTEITEQQAQLLPFGSYFLGVSTKTGDIDTVVVTSNHIQREKDFNEDLYAMIKNSPHIEHCNLIQSAQIPIITLSFKDNGQEFDISLCVLDKSKVPEQLEEELEGMERLDDKSQRSLNGWRDNKFIKKAMGSSFSVFKDAVKFIKLWTKKRGVNENKLGFFAGISYAIMVAKIIQLFPNFPLNKIIEMFFYIYSQWDWEVPVTINNLESS